MPDICMCKGGRCPLRESCYRYKATPLEVWQGYFINPPFMIKDGKPMCRYYAKMEVDG